MRKIQTLLLAVFATTVLMAAQAFAAPDSFVDVVKLTKDSVVHVMVEGTKTQAANPMFNDEFFRRFFGQPDMGQERKYEFNGLGTGFIIDKSGFIITNNHVIEDASQITVKTSDNKEYKANVVGRDRLTDLALLKIDPKGANLKVIALGNSDTVEIGEWVLAIGSPQGLEWTVTAGIISAKGRNLGAGPYDSFLQTDASINQGNSGGPLVNMKGEVVGINSMIFANSQGLGFAVPVNMLKSLLPQLKTGVVRRGWLGITLQDLDPKLAESFGLKDSNGALVADVMKDQPAAKAGIKSGDIITAADGTVVTNTKDIIQYVGSKQPNTTVRLTILRDGKTLNINVKLGERDDTGGIAGVQTPPAQSAPVITRDLSPAEKSQLDIIGGAVVTSVLEGSNASKAGLAAGDIIVWMNRKDIISSAQFNTEFNAVKSGGSISLKILNSSGARFIAFAKD